MAETTDTRRPAGVDELELRKVAASVLGEPVDGLSDVVAEPLAGGETIASTGGLWRFRGIASPAGRDWTAILKRLHYSTEGSELWRVSERPGDWNYWRREALAFESGLLERLPGAIRAPHCHGVFESGDGSVQLWLEDLSGQPGPTWSPERLTRAAFHLGLTQAGILSATALPDDDWLARDFLRSYLGQRHPDRDLLLDPQAQALPLARDWIGVLANEYVFPLWEARMQLLEALERLPQTVCHYDFWPPNLFADDDQSRTVAIDWGFVGIGAIGEDAGNLVPDSMLDFFIDSREGAAEFAELVFERYLGGLEEGGFQGTREEARLGFTIGASLKYTWMPEEMLKAAGDDDRLARIERSTGLPRDEWFARRLATMFLLRDLGREALAALGLPG